MTKKNNKDAARSSQRAATISIAKSVPIISPFKKSKNIMINPKKFNLLKRLFNLVKSPSLFILNPT